MIWNIRYFYKSNMLLIFSILVIFGVNAFEGEYQKKNSRSNRPNFFRKKGVLKSFAKFAAKHLRQGFFFNKVAGLRPAILLKKKLRHKCFPVNFMKFLETPFLTERLRWYE